MGSAPCGCCQRHVNDGYGEPHHRVGKRGAGLCSILLRGSTARRSSGASFVFTRKLGGLPRNLTGGVRCCGGLFTTVQGPL